MASGIMPSVSEITIRNQTGMEKWRGERREKNINVRLPLVHPLLGTWPATQARALTGNRTGTPLVRRPALNPLSHTSEGRFSESLD